MGHQKKLIYILIIILFSFEISSAISTLSGFVRDTNGQSIANVDLDFFDSQSGVKLITPGDNTDINGFYSVSVLNSTVYRVTFAPPQGNGLLGRQFINFDLTSSQALDVVLESGITISGIVSDSLGNPIGEVDLDVDSIGGGRVFTPDDNTFILNGFYSVVVPSGLFRIRYDSPVNSNFLGIQLDTVLITNDTTIDITMSAGNFLTGQITDNFNNGIFDVDIDIRDAFTGSKVFTSNNSTDTLGNYVVAVNSGIYQLRIAPTRGTRYIGQIIDSFAIVANDVFDAVLDEGLLCKVRIVDTLGNPVVGADIDVKDPITGTKLFTPNDKTTKIGETTIAVPQGIYNLQFDPPIGTTFEQILIPNVALNQDTLIELVMLQVPKINISGQIVNSLSAGISNVKISMFSSSTKQKIFLVGNSSDSLGFFNFQAPQGTFDLKISPPKGTHFIAKELLQLVITADTLVPTIILEDGVLVNFIIMDDTGAVVPFTDIDIFNSSSQNELFTPHDFTNQNGTAEAVLPPGTYDFIVYPPLELNLRNGKFSSIFIQNDSLITFKVFARPTSFENKNFIIKQNFPNPFNSITTINFEILSVTNVSIKIYNILGQKVKILTNKSYIPGDYSVRWDGTNQQGKKCSTGLYFYYIVTSRGHESRKVVLLK